MADAWGKPPSQDHKPSVAVMVFSESAFGSDKGYRFRGNSGAHNRFCQSVFEKAGAEANGKLPLIRITEVRQVKKGAGGTIDVMFDVAPADKWLELISMKLCDGLKRPNEGVLHDLVDVETATEVRANTGAHEGRDTMLCTPNQNVEGDSIA